LLHEISDDLLQFKFNYSRKLTFFPKKSAICMLNSCMPFPNLHTSATCKLGKGNNIKHAKGRFFRKKWIVKALTKASCLKFCIVIKNAHVYHLQFKIWLKLLNFVRKPFLICWKRDNPLVHKIWVREFFSLFYIISTHSPTIWERPTGGQFVDADQK
jgi:hypothetical protein